MEWLEAMVLGVIQGITEFLPVSSDGHLTVANILFERLGGLTRSSKEKIFFDVMLHVGTLAAILVHYRREGLAGARGLLGHSDVEGPYRRASVIRVGLLVGLATSVLIPDKLFFMKYIEQAFDSPVMVGFGFLITASVLAITASKLSGGDKGPSETTYLDALLIGIAQAFAPLPGVSRSGLTIAAALALGFRKTWAVQFSLMLAIPAIMGAAVFELKELDRSTLTSDRVLQTIFATILAGIVGYAAIVWLVRVVRAGRLWYFSVYLVVLGLGMIAYFSMTGGSGDAGKSSPVDRPASADPDPSPRGAVPTGGEGAVARPVGPRP